MTRLKEVLELATLFVKLWDVLNNPIVALILAFLGTTTYHLDISARGAGAQSMNRALKHKPDLKAAYSILLDSMKADFRRAWLATKSFEFTTTRKTTTTSLLKGKMRPGGS